MLLTEILDQEESAEVGPLKIFLVYHIHEKGWTRVYEGEDVNKLHYKFAE